MSVRFENGSFRDKDGFIFYHERKTYRAIRNSYQNQWETFLKSGLYKELTETALLIPCEKEVDRSLLGNLTDVYKIYKVPTLPFISYPCEWSFSQLKKAALLTLQLQKKAIQYNFSLKDASAYNVQFIGSEAIFIDSLSFEPYEEGRPWVAYKQFCQHFLAPLMLAHYGYEELQTLFIQNINGIPLSLCSKLLPFRSKFNLAAYTHIHIHAKFERNHSEDEVAKDQQLSISKKRVLAIVEHLEQGIRSLKIKNNSSHWTNYYSQFSYSEKAYKLKKEFVEKHLGLLKGKLCIDLGANSGEFSELAATYFEQVIACDNDVEVLKQIRKKKIKNILTLIIDLSTPTPAYGWANNERISFIHRIQNNDLCLALALLHHLCIGNNVPLNNVADFFNRVANHLIIEFIPKTDVQIKKLLVSKKDVFEDYTLDNFKSAFSRYYDVVDSCPLPDSERVLFFLKNKTDYASA